MEIVIPPRDHAKSTYRYTWDENGEVTRVSRLNEQQRQQQQQQQQQRAERRASIQDWMRGGRQTIQWPFHSIVTETDLSSPVTSQFPRRATWQPKQSDGDSESAMGDVIPDYVINYIRGETPETVARRKRNKGKIGERAVDIAHQHEPHESRVADFEGFYEEGTIRGSSGAGYWQGDEEGRELTDFREKRHRGKARRPFEGWRFGVAINVLLSVLIFTVGIVCLIITLAKTSAAGGEAVVYAGSCTTASAINWALHAATSVLALVLISGANYVFQVLSSPTRPELTAAHGKKEWLDIGIPSVRNFAHIGGSRSLLAVIVLLSAVITHTIYNSVIFVSRAAFDDNVVVVTESFLKGAQFSNDTMNNSGGLSRLDILALQDLAARNQLVNLTTTQCSQEFGGAYQSDYKSVLFVTNSKSQTSSLLQTIHSGSISQYPSVDDVDGFALNGSTVLYCLAQQGSAQDQTCTVGVNGLLLGIVVVLNLVTIITISIVLTKRLFEPLVTLGDAISSFLKDPDPTTRGACLMSKPDVWQGRWGLREAKYWIPSNHYWFRSPSLPRWIFFIFMWLATAGLAATALVLSVRADPTGTLSAFGTASTHAFYSLPSTLPVWAAAVIAGLPQLLLAVLYFVTNSLLTTYYLSHESSLYALGQPLPLRVSANPEGQQTTGIYLTLPRPWSWFLVTLFAGMSFVLSQSVLVVSIFLTDSAPSSSSDSSSTASPGTLVGLGFSGVGLLAFGAILVVLGAVVVGLGFRTAPAAVLVNGQAVGNPLALPAGSCSAVLSARSHRIPGEASAWKRPLTWGVVHEGRGMGASHCTYTARGAAQLDIARSYA